MIRKLIKYTIILSLIVIGGVSLFVFSVSQNLFGHLYSIEEIKSFTNENASLMISEDGKTLGKIFAENRTNIRYEELPKHLIDALVATEDVRYFEHEGVDSRSLARVLFKTIILGDNRSGGGSTITQQLAKNMYGRKDFGALTMPVNKTKEALLAKRIESIYTKEEILTLYLNTIPFGENVFGIEAASKRFYNVNVSALSVDQSAVLIGLLKANTYYNPRLYPDHAKLRRDVVLSQMHKYEYLTEEEKELYQEEPIELDYANLESEGVANYFLRHVKSKSRELVEQYNLANGTSLDLKKDGLIIQTTLNYEMQEMALNAFETHLIKMQKHLRNQYKSGASKKELTEMVSTKISNQKLTNRANNYKKQELFNWSETYTDSITVKDSIAYFITQLHAGMLGIDPNNGAIRVWVGGVDYRKFPYDQVQAKRQIASAFKPILYAAALDYGILPCAYLDNDEMVFTDYDNWTPKNYDNSYGGQYSLQAALIKSKNIPTVNLYFDVGFENLDYLWQKLDFSSELNNSPSTSLGTANASIYEMAKAYSCFANGGYLVEPQFITSIKTPSGDIIYESEDIGLSNRVIDESTSKYMNHILEGAVKRGTGVALPIAYGITHPLAGKTGTSQNYSDAWFASYTSSFVLVTRVGANSPRIHFKSGVNGSGSRLALPLAGLFWKSAQQNPSIKNKVYGPFQELSEEQIANVTCPDFEEGSKLDNFLDNLKNSNTNSDKKSKKSEKKKKKSEKKKKKKKWWKRN